MKKLSAHFTLILALLLLAGGPVLASEKTPAVQAQEETAPPSESKMGVVVLPVLFYMPETKLGGGVGGQFTYRSAKDVAAKSRPSSLYFYLIYTQLKQFQAQFQPQLYFDNEKYLISGKLDFSKFPDKYWGMGPDTPDDAEKDFTPRTYSVEMSFQKKIWPAQNLYAGFQVKYENIKILSSEEGFRVDRGTIPGEQGGTAFGLGLILNRDTRDNVFYPTRGDYWQLGGYVYPKALGSTSSFTSIKADFRHYIPLFGTHVLALQGLLQAMGGDPLFMSYTKLGGDTIMRGYYSGRYRDKVLAVVQAEYRLPLIWRFGLVGFGGLGDVAPSLGDIKFDALKYSVGFGIRFKIVRKEGTNLRVDFAWGKSGNSGFYFTANEAF